MIPSFIHISLSLGIPGNLQCSSWQFVYLAGSSTSLVYARETRSPENLTQRSLRLQNSALLTQHWQWKYCTILLGALNL